MADKPLFDRYFHEKHYEGSECNFTTLFMWRKGYSIRWAVEENFLFVLAAYDNLPYMLPPYGQTEEGFIRAVDRAVDYFAANGISFSMRGVSPLMTECLTRLRPGRFKIEPRREVFDYVYNVRDLIELKGRNYRNKMNHINSFKREFSQYQYLPLSKELVPECIEYELEWCAKRECEGDLSLIMEREAIIDGLENYSQLGFRGGVIKISGKVEAFTLGEQLNSDTVLIHVEKGNPDIRGIYPVINQEFLRHDWSHMKFVNREEDMGIEGLRIAKESYRPVKLVEKYEVTLQKGC
ncbi:MAG: hypothetical protein H6Q66_867 [Firmicutes bacterium]|nr:hypothetical protein [Bacillota bacterium]